MSEQNLADIEHKQMREREALVAEHVKALLGDSFDRVFGEQSKDQEGEAGND